MGAGILCPLLSQILVSAAYTGQNRQEEYVMKDSFYEQIVPVKRSRAAFWIKIVIFLLILAGIVLVSFIFLGIAAVIIGWVTGMLFYFFLYPRFNVEYEYSLVNYTLDIHVVYSKSKRKHLYTLDLREAGLMAPVNSPELGSYKSVKVRDISSGTGAFPCYSIITTCNDSEINFVIEPDREMLDRIRPWLGRKFIEE